MLNPNAQQPASFTPQYILKKYFGYEEFRPLQEEIVEHVLQGNDALVLMPTGGGKSLCYQLPAMLKPGLALVVSPLISLMKDQVDSLKANGIPAAFLNSSLSMAEEGEVLRNCILGNIKLLYIAPERLLNSFVFLKDNLEISLIAIDEAHCISAWGHDFRPEYTQLSVLKQQLPQVPLVALTATADKVTRRDILAQLQIPQAEVFISSFNRPNLSLSVRTAMTEREKVAEIVYFIRQRFDESGIIYCLSRKGTEALATQLEANGIPASYYHAGMTAEQRSFVQDEFIHDRIQVICATVAFGMGIDKSNVRWVIHYNLPKNIEGFYQEIGRAGRDGLQSDTLLYYNLADLQLLTKFASDSGQVALNLEKLERMQHYAEADICRRKILLNYFSENTVEDCGNCDVCANPPKHFDGTVLIQKALSALARMHEKVGTQTLIDVLRGSHKQEILEAGYDQIKTYGAGSDISAGDWKRYVLQMLNLGIMEMAYDEHFSLKITELGREILHGKRQMNLVHLHHKAFSVAKRTAQPKPENQAQSAPERLLAKLKQIRRSLADALDLAAYQIFSDKSLEEIVFFLPVDEVEFLQVHGISQKKWEDFGQYFLPAVQQFVEQEQLNKQERPKRPTRHNTIDTTLELYRKGITVAQIAEQRNLSQTTVFSHIAQLFLENKIQDLSQWITQAEVEAVRQALTQLEGGATKLKPIYELLGETLAYPKIRLALAFIEKSSK